MTPELAQILNAVVIPLILGLLRHFFPQMPPIALPLGAVALGAASGGANPQLDYVQGILSGLAGVGMFEVTDQTRKAARARAATEPKKPS